ncbi:MULTISPECIES: glycosyltransferase [Clostridium]|uniref:glycosyltransferase n=1 Tax=Clostridium TaxID=1485 RepID=UPI001898C6EE|nr:MULTISPECIES: glycosyltransferase [Clostridium]MDI9217073.1 glycosyltransferase [Clostridium tertium]
MYRVLHFGICASLGGIETYLLKITKNFSRQKYKFDFLVIGNENPCFFNELKDFGCDFFFVESRKKNYFKYIYELNKLFKNEKFDIVHCHLNSLKNISVVLVALKYGNKVIVHSRNGGGDFNLVEKIVNKINYYRLPKRKVKLLAVSNIAGKWMYGDNEDFIVINNSVDIEKYKFNNYKRDEIRKLYNLEGTKVIIHTGAFRKQKNHRFLIDIFNEILKIDSNYRLLLIGEGSLKYEIENRVDSYGIKDKVLFLGARSDISELLSSADIYLFPSLFEGFPNSLIEAEANGLTCLVSDIITNEVIIANLCEVFSLKRSAEEWAKKIVSMKIINDREYGINYLKNNNLDINNEIMKLDKIYKEVIES